MNDVNQVELPFQSLVTSSSPSENQHGFVRQAINHVSEGEKLRKTELCKVETYHQIPPYCLHSEKY